MMIPNFVELLREFRKLPLNINQPVFCDTETTTKMGETDGGLYGAIRLFQVFQNGWEKAIIYDCFFVDLMDILDMLRPCRLVFHNGSYDLHTINSNTEELWLPEDVDDTLYLSKLTFFQKSKFDFYSCLAYAGHNDKFIKAIDKKKNQKADWGGPLNEELLTYAGLDVTHLSLLYQETEHKRDTESYQLDIFNLKYAVEYSRRGIPINKKTVVKQLLSVTNELEDLMDKLPEDPVKKDGTILNFNSYKQCQKLLGTSSSDAETLIRLSLSGNMEADLIHKCRKNSKLRSFLIKYNRDIIKGYYNPSAAISGRFSCTGGDRYDHENLQQIHKMILPCLEAPDGMVFIYKDYAALELRAAVAYIGEDAMDALMRAGVDLHTYTASVVFNIPMDQVTKDMRTVGKVLNFQTIYGAGVGTTQATMMAWGGLIYNKRETSAFISTWYDEYPMFRSWQNAVKTELQVKGYIDTVTALGRVVRTMTLNDALNIPIQGTASEVTKTSLRLLKEGYPSENLVSTIHDSNTLLVVEDEAEYWRDVLNECMVGAWYDVTKNLAVPDLPMPAEAEIGKIWDF